MIPLQLTLKNFLSYRKATLDFRGLHVACICGANGAGKSSLLEAITWALWGQSRALTEDDVIHLGELDAIVDFIFQYQQQTYRVIRSRRRGQASTLEFQIQTTQGFRSLTEKGLRATQQLILYHLKLDYDTFINSAYLRQGRADEFMLKRPTERKQILTDLLKLDRYDELAEQAKEQVRQLKADLGSLERNLETIAAQLQQGEGLAIEEANLRVVLNRLHHQQEQDQQRLRQQQAIQQQRQAGVQQLTLQQQQQQHLLQDCRRLQQDLNQLQQQQRQLEAILQDAETIATHYNQFQRLQAEEELQSAKVQTYQAAQTQLQALRQQQAEQVNRLTDDLRRLQAQQESLLQQQQEIQETLSKAAEVEAALEHLRQARTRLTEMDHLQMKAAPLVQRRQQIQTQLDRAQARLIARLEELRTTQRQLEQHQHRQPHLQQAIEAITQQIAHLEKRRLYQQQVREKGMERRTFMERLQERQREYERDLAELDQKIALLKREHPESLTESRLEPIAEPVAVSQAVATDHRLAAETDGVYSLSASLPRAAELRPKPLSLVPSPEPYPPCPLCDRPLDEHHWNVVLEHHQTERQEICTQLWVIREQLTTSDREIRILRQEYRDLDKELAQQGAVLERRGQLQQQLRGIDEEHDRLEQVKAEIEQLQQALAQQAYATELQEEWQLLEHSLTQLNYDDKNHALARGEVDRWRWAEIKYAEIKQAQRKQAQIAEQHPQLEQQIAAIDQQLQALSTSALQQQINQLSQQMTAIGYSLEHHTAVRNALRQAQPWQMRYQELRQAQQTYPQIQQRLRELADLWATRTQALQAAMAQVEHLSHQLEQLPDPLEQIQAIEQQMQQRRVDLDQQLAQLGRLQQQQQQLVTLSAQHATLTTQLQTAQRQYRIYQELSQAFGKNGIQALMIENVLPQLEAETNHILARLSANQLHVQFVTQRAKRNAQRHDKLIDTLDILISDVQGTRPYETYSGGEAFRVNFAIRLAMARLLAQRSGTALQMLIVDEGFGTQDDAGCDRLIGAINAIASDFACVLTVTHMPHLKEAFQTRIEVSKTEQGSQVRLLA